MLKSKIHKSYITNAHLSKEKLGKCSLRQTEADQVLT